MEQYRSLVKPLQGRCYPNWITGYWEDPIVLINGEDSTHPYYEKFCYGGGYEYFSRYDDGVPWSNLYTNNIDGKNYGIIHMNLLNPIDSSKYKGIIIQSNAYNTKTHTRSDESYFYLPLIDDNSKYLYDSGSWDSNRIIAPVGVIGDINMVYFSYCARFTTSISGNSLPNYQHVIWQWYPIGGPSKTDRVWLQHGWVIWKVRK